MVSYTEDYSVVRGGKPFSFKGNLWRNRRLRFDKSAGVKEGDVVTGPSGNEYLIMSVKRKGSSSEIEATYIYTDAQKMAVFRNSMHYEILYTFGIPDGCRPKDYFQWEVINFAKLSHARVLCTFLQHSLANRFDSDVVAEDYGFPEPTIFADQNDPDWIRLNKDLLHLSYERLRHTRESKRWRSTVLERLWQPTVEFMGYILNNRECLFANSGDRQEWVELIEHLKSKKEIIVKGERADGKIKYKIILGRRFPGGKPADLSESQGNEGLAVTGGGGTNAADHRYLTGPPPPP